MSRRFEPLDDTVLLTDMGDISTSIVNSYDTTMDDGSGSGSLVPEVSVSGPDYNASDVVAYSNYSASQSAAKPRTSKRKSYMTVAVMVFINLLNYMDRFTIAGVLSKVQHYFHIEGDNQLAGLIQTSFIISYMLFSPLFGYLGDRYNRKIIMGFGIFFWSALTLASSFVPGEYFWVFLLLRALVGIGEASYSTIAPTIIADLFANEMRTRMLAVFYFAIPIGSGLGYIVGSNVADALHQWQWALRVTPMLGILSIIFLFCFTVEPPRGESEGGTQLHATRYFDDLKHLCKTPSFVLSTVGFTCVTFVTGALAFWAPAYFDNSLRATGQFMDLGLISLIFGIITCGAGFIGVGAGAEIARRVKKTNPRGDALVCAFGLITCAPFLYIALITAQYNFAATCVIVFIGETLLCLNWTLVADILLYIVIPTRRSTAEAFQILISHLLGDAGSPYLIGVVSDLLRGDRDPALPAVQFQTFQYALYMCTFVCVLGGGAFLACALYIEEDKKRADNAIKASQTIVSESESDDDLLDPDPTVEDAKHSFRRTQIT